MLKRFYCILFLLLLAHLAVYSQTTANDLWRQAQIEEKQENYSKAIELYKRCKNSTDDKLFKADCDDKIKTLEMLMSQPFINAPDTVFIPYTGEYQKITIVSNPRNWSYGVVSGLLREVKKDGSQLLIVSQPNNSKLDTNIAVIRISAGKRNKDIVVVQQPSPEYLHSSSEELNVPAVGEQCQVEISANYKDWSFEVDSTWIEVKKSDDRLTINVSPNDLAKIREGKIVLHGKDKSLVIRIYQGAGDEKLMFSQNNLFFPVDGETRTIAVYTNADNWYVGNSPDWCKVDKVGPDSISITTFRNTSDNIPREASVSVNTGLQTQSIRIYQDARPYVPPYVPMVKGRNVSFGLTASILLPDVSTSAGGDYVGSVVNYGLCDKNENANYTSAKGFTAGVFSDIRLYRNIFFNVGVNYTMYSYKNRFDQPVEITEPHTENNYIRGTVENAFREDYTFAMIDVPMIASYRFYLKDNSHIQLNLGPVINYGLTAKVRVSGNSDSENLYLYNNRTDQVVGSGYVRHYTYNAEMSLYNNIAEWTQSSTAHNDIPITHKEVFVDSPFKRLNYSMQIGTTYEISGVSFGIIYSVMLSNMANNGYWDGRRWYLHSQGYDVMSGYKQRINTLQLRFAYTFRYDK